MRGTPGDGYQADSGQVFQAGPRLGAVCQYGLRKASAIGQLGFT